MIEIDFEYSYPDNAWNVWARRNHGDKRWPIKMDVTVGPPIELNQSLERSATIRDFEMRDVSEALIRGLGNAGLIKPMDGTTAELKAVREELAILRVQHDKLLNSITDIAVSCVPRKMHL